MALKGGYDRSPDWIPTFEAKLQPGIYPAKLVSVEDCEIPPFKEGGSPVDGIHFKYQLDPGDGQFVTVNRQVTKKVGGNSHLIKDLMGITGGDIPEDVLNDDAKLNKLIEDQVGKSVMIGTSLKSGKKDPSKKYTRWESVSLARGGGRVEEVEITDADLDSDDIPF